MGIVSGLFSYYMFKFIRTVAALFMAPAAFFLTYGFSKTMVMTVMPTSTLGALVLGCAAGYILINSVPAVSDLLYVTGHEFSHALCLVLSGGKVRNISIGMSGGKVVGTKGNFFVAVFPYIIPFYTIAFSLAWKFYEALTGHARGRLPFFFFIGVTWMFHLIYTFRLLKTRQEDTAYAGIFFSLVFVYLANLMIAVGLYGLMETGNGVAGAFSSVTRNAMDFYFDVSSICARLFHFV